MDAVVRRDTTFTLRLDAFDGNTSWQAHSRRVGAGRSYDMCHAHHNRHAEPFIWTATAATILRKVRHRKQA
jgi:hypothetical protein